MKFRNKNTGVTLEPSDKFVIEELQKQTDKYEVIGEKPEKTAKTEVK